MKFRNAVLISFIVCLWVALFLGCVVWLGEGKSWTRFLAAIPGLIFLIAGVIYGVEALAAIGRDKQLKRSK
jgi:hypothetical protein